MSSTAIAKGSVVLVTGVNGYLGLHVADQLISQGYKVLGTVRDEAKATWTKEHFDKTYGAGKFNVVIVKDLGVEGAFDDLMKDVSGVVHVASDVSFGTDPNKVITPMINGVKSILRAAAMHPSVKSFVYTSSAVAIDHPKLGKEYEINASMWNEEAVKMAWKEPPYGDDQGVYVYSASKTQVEQTAREIVKNSPGNFRFNTVNPFYIVGKTLHENQGKYTAGLLLGIANNDAQAMQVFRTLPPQWMVDVVDVAKLHVVALVDPEIDGERLLAYTEKIDFNIVVDKLTAILGKEKMKDVEKMPELEKDMTTVDVKRSEELLRGLGQKGFKSFDESLKELFASQRLMGFSTLGN